MDRRARRGRGGDASMLTINEIYLSIQGESTYAGRPCTFVRLTACDLRCAWCDTPYAFTEGRKMALEDVVAEVDRLGCPLVELTGGEPMLQKEAVPLMERLLEGGRTVLIETGGHIDLSPVPRAVVRIVDVKCPGSGESAKHHWPNLERLAPHDEVKFVIADRVDYEYARGVTLEHRLGERAAAVHFSPVHGVLDPKVLSAWILEDHLPVRLQLQLHKYIWEPTTRGV
jgi:7-carboxy-7-deazaguanine synthase